MLSAAARPASLELHVLRVAEIEPTPAEVSLLDAEERRRADRLRAEDRAGYVAAHVRLRQLLSVHLGRPPREIAFVREPCPRCGGPNGRPAVEGGSSRPLHFSLSRSGEVVLIAIAAAPVGVDVESVPVEATVAEVTELLHAEERAEILAAAPAARAETFARIWTRKEAYLKALGTGVAHDLELECLASEAPAGWHVAGVPVPVGYRAAVAVEVRQITSRRPAPR